MTLAQGQGLVLLVMAHWQVPGWAAKVLQGGAITQTAIEDNPDIVKIFLGRYDVAMRHRQCPAGQRRFSGASA